MTTFFTLLMTITADDRNLGQFTIASERANQEFIWTSPVGIDRAEITVAVPILNIQGYWHANRFRPSMMLEWRISADFAAQKVFPCLCFFDQAQSNRLTMLLDCPDSDVFLCAAMDQGRHCYNLTWTVSVSAGQTIRIAADTSNGFWSDTVMQMAQTLRPAGLTFPQSAWRAVFCSWYACHYDMNGQSIAALAAQAAELGFGTFILDDGWSDPLCKRVNPQTLPDWYANIGDWEISKEKFPDFAGHVRQVQAMGLAYMIWMAPLMMGHKSNLYKRFASSALTKLHEGYVIADPACPEVRTCIFQRAASLMRNYGLDGLKIDFLDDVPVDVNRPYGRIMRRFVQELAQTIRAAKNDALIEFRQRYIGPAMLPYATQFRAGDVPYDFLENVNRLTHLRLCIGNGVPIHADPAYWHPHESDANVARHMICAMAGVPMLSMLLTACPASHKAIIKAFLSFYRSHQKTFTQGQWTVRYLFDGVAWLGVGGGHETLVLVIQAAAMKSVREYLQHNEGQYWIINGAETPLDIEGLAGKPVIYDYTLTPVEANLIGVGGAAFFNRSKPS